MNLEIYQKRGLKLLTGLVAASLALAGCKESEFDLYKYFEQTCLSGANDQNILTIDNIRVASLRMPLEEGARVKMGDTSVQMLETGPSFTPSAGESVVFYKDGGIGIIIYGDQLFPKPRAIVLKEVQIDLVVDGVIYDSSGILFTTNCDDPMKFPPLLAE